MCLKTRTYRGAAAPEPARLVVGEAGLIMMKYTGLGMVSETGEFKGLATGAVYRFGMDKPVGYVDMRDAPGLLATFEDGLPAFEVMS